VTCGAASFRPGRETGRIGLLGGSFNPAHDGHRHVSLLALKHLGLDEVWWLVSPQNPLKSATGMGSFDERIATARAVARHPRIRVSDAEQVLGTRYTIDTIRKLQRRFPQINFVWLMGADNLVQLPRWRRWEEICRRLPVAVLARPSYSLKGAAAKPAIRFAGSRIPSRAARLIGKRRPPAWVLLPSRLHPASATAIRAARNKG
jgi:nicotinate-nucleotide adenylyltransferase